MEEFDERAIFARCPVVVFRWQNAPGWPVEYVSPNAPEVFGHSAEDFLSGRVPYASLIHEDDAARVASEVSEASASEAASFVHAPYRIRHRDGTVSWLHDVTRIVRGADGMPTHFFGYVVDVTSRMLAEEQARELERRLLHAQKLESLGVLAGGIAHDFNNLLTGILGQASLARRLGQVDGRTLESLEQIELLARRAAELTRQLLSYSGRGNVLVEPVDLGELVDETVSMLGLAVSRTTTLVVERAASLPAIDADRAQIQQIVMNLLTNAGEALEGRAGRVTLRLRADDDEVRLEVEDTGRGMTEEVRQKLFDPFFTTKGAGRGLGLSAVLGIVRAHGGRIEVRSTPDVGSTVGVTFPASPSRPRRRMDSLPPAPAKRRGTVLVVDDERAIRRSVRAILEHAGHAVLEASDGQEGLTVFDQHRDTIVLVLLDLTMPGMSGPETFVALRERSAVPIVLTSGFSARHDAIIERASAFLQKPYTADDLERTLGAILAG
jgi:PAS domain S-box-containing protein